jgi:hypothetical protein
MIRCQSIIDNLSNLVDCPSMVTATVETVVKPRQAQTWGKPDNTNRSNRPKSQCVHLQNIIYAKAIVDGIDLKVLSSLTRAWKELEDARRILIGKPLPGSYRPEKKAKIKASPFSQLKSAKAAIVLHTSIEQPLVTPVTHNDGNGSVTR